MRPFIAIVQVSFPSHQRLVENTLVPASLSAQLVPSQ